MLGGLRVVDCTDDRGTFAGYLLAALGADVVAVEPLGGCAARRIGPYSSNGESLYWKAYGRGKRSVAVDLATHEGEADLARLIDTADVLLETGRAGTDSKRNVLRAIEANAGLLRVNITPFGSGGPKADWPATDLTIAASAGQMMLTGDADRAPLRISVDQVYLHACLEAVGATLIALYERECHSGAGQSIDVSAQEAFLLASQCQMLGHPLNGRSAQRNGGGAKVGPISLRMVYPCRDGFVVAALAFGAAIGRFLRNLMDVIFEEGLCDDATRSKDWINYGMLLLGGQEPISEWDRVQGIVAEFLAGKTKAELLELALRRHLTIAPLSTTADILRDEHLRDRGCFDEHDGSRFPGRFAVFGRAPLRPLAPAPAIGQHTREVLRDIAVAKSSPSAAVPRADVQTDRALEGLKVLDFMWLMAGPAGSRVLADHGATVVRVESTTRIDAMRTLGPFRDDSSDPEFSGPYHNVNAGKLGITLDLTKAASRAVVADLVRWADVVLESYAPGAFARAGYTYENLSAINPSIIMVSSSLLGQTGPLAPLAGYGNMAAAVAGFTYLTGWPDRSPAGPFSAYTDTTSPRFLTIAVLAALEHRRRTGEGQYIDLSQAESAISLLAPALLDYQLNGVVAERAGNGHPVWSPHAVFPCAGEERWVAISCRDDHEWEVLCDVMSLEDLRGTGLAERRAREAEIAARISGWTATRNPDDVTALLCKQGLPSHTVQGSRDCYDDPQLAHRGYFVEVSHPTQPGGTTWVEGPRAKLDRTPAVVRDGGPTFGQHNDAVLRGLLGYDDERIADIVIAGALE